MAASQAELSERLELIDIQKELCERSFYRFFQEAWHVMDPAPFADTWHLGALCEHLQLVTEEEIFRLIISMPPRMTKSLSCSVAWPVWSWIRNPKVQFLTSSYDHGLSKRDAMKSRLLIDSPWFQERWGDRFTIRRGENTKQRYTNTDGGHRIAISSGGKTTGDGGDIILLDDSHNARDVYSDVKRENILEWYDNAMRSRLNNQNTGKIVHVGQRVHDMDVIGHVIKKQGRATLETPNGMWTHLVMPNEFRVARKCVTYLPKDIKRAANDADYEPKPLFEDPRTEEDELICPERLDREATDQLRPPLGMTQRDYNSQYQQDPAADDGLILKRSFWQPWEYPSWHPEAHKKRPMPEVELIVQIYDTAFEEKEENDFSARTTWGIFSYSPERMHPKTGAIIQAEPRRCAILLEAWRDKIPSYELRREAQESYNDYDPDFVIIEKKASGHGLIQELRKAGVRVKWVDPKGKDKVARAHMAALPMEQGCIFFVPGHKDAYKVIEECAKFPVAEYDDWTDTVVMGMAFLRRMGSIEFFDEDVGELNLFQQRRKSIYG